MANAKANVNVKIDAEVKARATQILARMGLDQTTAIDMYFRQIIKERRLPFQPEAAMDLDEQLLAAIRNRNIPHKAVKVNADGYIIADRNKDPDLYDWAVNG